MGVDRLDIECAIEIYGVTKLASYFGVSRATIYNWLNGTGYYIEVSDGECEFEGGEYISSSMSVHRIIKSAGIPNKLCGDGHVYIVSDGETMKIGFSLSPESRVKQVGIKRDRVFISSAVENPRELESMAHAEFHKLRLHGEYFTDSFDEAVRFISKNTKTIRAIPRKRVKPKAETIIRSVEEVLAGKGAAR